jgi:hypothetical protein
MRGTHFGRAEFSAFDGPAGSRTAAEGCRAFLGASYMTIFSRERADAPRLIESQKVWRVDKMVDKARHIYEGRPRLRCPDPKTLRRRQSFRLGRSFDLAQLRVELCQRFLRVRIAALSIG